MSARYLYKVAHEATWARRIALFFLQLLLLTVLLHRFSLLGTPVAMNLLAVSVLGLVLAVAISAVALTRIWFGGHAGASQAFGAIGIALIGLALPLWSLSQLALLPPLTDIETT